MLINLTPHPVVFSNGITLNKCDQPPRLAERSTDVGDVDGIPVREKTFDKMGCSLPPVQSGVFFVVPLAIAQAFKEERSDLLVPNELIRDEQGRIVACQSLARVR